MTAQVPNITLNNGVEIPAIGLGLFQTPPYETLHAFDKSAFDKTLAAYRALEKLYADGKVRAIGVSNFMVEHLEQLLAQAGVVPSVNQIEVHPYFQQREVQALDAEHGILTQVDQGTPHRRELRRLRLRADPGPVGSHRRSRHRKAGAAPSPRRSLWRASAATSPTPDCSVGRAGPLGGTVKTVPS